MNAQIYKSKLLIPVEIRAKSFDEAMRFAKLASLSLAVQIPYSGFVDIPVRRDTFTATQVVVTAIKI